MMTESTHSKQRRPRPTPRARGEQKTTWKLLVLTAALGVYLALFGILPRVDASRQAAQNTTKGTNDAGNGAVVQPPPVVLVAPPLTPLVIPADLQGVGARPAAVTIGGTKGGQTLQVGPAPVQVAPLPTIAPLPQVAMPVVRSRGS